jgi:hypothetical protein
MVAQYDEGLVPAIEIWAPNDPLIAGLYLLSTTVNYRYDCVETGAYIINEESYWTIYNSSDASCFGTDGLYENFPPIFEEPTVEDWTTLAGGTGPIIVSVVRNESYKFCSWQFGT